MKKLFLLSVVIYMACSFSQKPVALNRADVPVCIRKMIQKFRARPKQNPPGSIYSYSFDGRTVYYVTAVCCDQFSDLYDSNCNLIGHPDGGFTGKGDGKTGNFNETKTAEKLIWKDSR